MKINSNAHGYQKNLFLKKLQICRSFQVLGRGKKSVFNFLLTQKKLYISFGKYEKFRDKRIFISRIKLFINFVFFAIFLGLQEEKKFCLIFLLIIIVIVNIMKIHTSFSIALEERSEEEEEDLMIFITFSSLDYEN